MDYRIEKDSMGEIKVEVDKMWKAQTQRSLENFHIGQEKMPQDLIYSIIKVKKAVAIVNKDNGKLEEHNANAIIKACDDVLSGQYDDQFPLSVWQTGSGTQTNMNVNEVISSIASKNYSIKIHPNDHVNKSQSTNDVFPTAIHLASYTNIKDDLLPALEDLVESLDRFKDRVEDVIKVGRTHLQDATPLKVKQEISAWSYALKKSLKQIQLNLPEIAYLAIGGTAVGTGLNTFEGYDNAVVEKLREMTGCDFKVSDNKFYSLSSKNELLMVHSSLNGLAMELLKIGNDIRWLSSGPRAGLGEYIIPSNEPGSSIMPGKVNPTQVEALSMVCGQVLGNQTSIAFACSQGNFQLNVFMPLIAYNMLQSIRLLSDIMRSVTVNMIDGMAINKEKIEANLRRSLMNVTALNPYIGYDNSARLAKYAHENNLSLIEANRELKILDEDKIIEYLDPTKMV